MQKKKLKLGARHCNRISWIIFNVETDNLFETEHFICITSKGLWPFTSRERGSLFSRNICEYLQLADNFPAHVEIDGCGPIAGGRVLV